MVELRAGIFSANLACSKHIIRYQFTQLTEKTAVTIPFGLCEFIRMAFGLKNERKTLQRFIQELFQILSDEFVYSDGVLVASSDVDSHLETLDSLLRTLNEYGFRVNLTNCKWLNKTFDFLEFKISSDSIRPLALKVEILIDLKEPKKYKELQRIMETFLFAGGIIRNMH